MERLELISVAGNPDRRRDHPLLLVHGICHGAWCWQPNFAPFFADLGYDVHALSLRGHAGSSGHESLHRNRISDYVDDVVEAATGLPAKPIIVGHSMGGAITQLAVQHASQPAAAAVLLTPMVPGGLTARELLRTAARLGGIPPFLRLLRGRPLTPKQANRLPFFDNRLDSDDADLAAERLHAESRRALGDLRRFNPPAGRVQVPLLVVGSSQDRIFGAPSLRRTAAHYGVDATILDSGCHDLMLDPGWRESADVIATWMEKL